MRLPLLSYLLTDRQTDKVIPRGAHKIIHKNLEWRWRRGGQTDPWVHQTQENTQSYFSEKSFKYFGRECFRENVIAATYYFYYFFARIFQYVLKPTSELLENPEKQTT